MNVTHKRNGDRTLTLDNLDAARLYELVAAGRQVLVKTVANYNPIFASELMGCLPCDHALVRRREWDSE